MEAIGFWIIFIGWILLVVLTMIDEQRMKWIEKTLHIPWFVQIVSLPLAIILIAIGMQLWCIGNQGRYPGYPLNVMLERFR